MFKFFKQGFRINSRRVGSTYKGLCDTRVLPQPDGSLHINSNSLDFFQCNSQSHLTASFGALWISKSNRKLNEIHSVRNLVIPFSCRIQQDIIGKINFHTSSCLNYEYDNDQTRERRNANRLILMTVLAVVLMTYLYSLIDPEEYDRPTVVKE